METLTERALMDVLDARPTFTPEASPRALIDGDLYAAFAAGVFPAARFVHVARVATGNDLSLPGGRVARTVAYLDSRWLLVEGPEWRVRFCADSDGETWAWVFGTTTALVDEIGAVIAGWNQPPVQQPDSVEVTFCYRSDHFVSRRRRRISALPWTSIAVNYSAAVRERFERLVAMEPTKLNGRLMLLWGPPGTGKTTLLRTLALQWTPWCETVYVTDPDRLFNDPAYLNAIMLDGDDDEADEQSNEAARWILLLLEDCDELIRPDAKHASGQALSRLLNLTDGMVGQGLRLLVCLTTNEELWRLHPAVTRPGRCLAQIEVGRLSRAEAAMWLSEHDTAASITGHVGPDGVTLAELFALHNGDPTAAVPTAHPVGQYL